MKRALSIALFGFIFFSPKSNAILGPFNSHAGTCSVDEIKAGCFQTLDESKSGGAYSCDCLGSGTERIDGTEAYYSCFKACGGEAPVFQNGNSDTFVYFDDTGIYRQKVEGTPEVQQDATGKTETWRIQATRAGAPLKFPKETVALEFTKKTPAGKSESISSSNVFPESRVWEWKDKPYKTSNFTSAYTDETRDAVKKFVFQKCKAIPAERDALELKLSQAHRDLKFLEREIPTGSLSRILRRAAKKETEKLIEDTGKNIEAKSTAIKKAKNACVFPSDALYSAQMGSVIDIAKKKLKKEPEIDIRSEVAPVPANVSGAVVEPE